MFDEGVELVSVWMMPGLEEVAHVGSEAALLVEIVLLENDEV